MPPMIPRERTDELLRAVFRQLKAMGGRGRPKDVLSAVAASVALTEAEKESTRTGSIRWRTNVRFYTVDCSRAGYLRKEGGEWFLTPQGEQALKLPPGDLLKSAQQHYRAWRHANADAKKAEELPKEVEPEIADRVASFEEAAEAARGGIEQHIDGLDPYELQGLVAELLKAMGYHVARVAEPGPDGGVDVEAYTDPLGTKSPRLRVQVKHRNQKAEAKEVRELSGLLRKEGDVGLLVSTGGITEPAKLEARNSAKHVETMDLDRLITLWQEHYDRLSERGKALLPLTPVYFLSPKDPA